MIHRGREGQEQLEFGVSEVLALVVAGVANDHYDEIGARGNGGVVVAVHHLDAAGSQRGLDARQQSHRIGSVRDVAGSGVAKIGDGGQRPQHGDPPQRGCVHRQKAVVA